MSFPCLLLWRYSTLAALIYSSEERSVTTFIFSACTLSRTCPRSYNHRSGQPMIVYNHAPKALIEINSVNTNAVIWIWPFINGIPFYYTAVDVTRQTYTQTDRQTDRQTDKQTNTPTNISSNESNRKRTPTEAHKQLLQHLTNSIVCCRARRKMASSWTCLTKTIHQEVRIFGRLPARDIHRTTFLYI